MNIRTIRSLRYAAIVVAMFGFFLGCQHQTANIQPLTPPCIPPTGNKIDMALSQARADLSNNACQVKYDLYFQRLLDIAEGEPKIENKKKMSEFLEWSNTNGLLTMIQTKELYNRYFNTTFMSLPDEYNTCYSCRKKATIEIAMKHELIEKEKGLMKVCADKESYFRASSQFKNYLTVLDAVCLACESGQ